VRSSSSTRTMLQLEESAHETVALRTILPHNHPTLNGRDNFVKHNRNVIRTPASECAFSVKDDICTHVYRIFGCSAGELEHAPKQRGQKSAQK
jgi:hypothetical protein